MQMSDIQSMAAAEQMERDGGQAWEFQPESHRLTEFLQVVEVRVDKRRKPPNRVPNQTSDSVICID